MTVYNGKWKSSKIINEISVHVYDVEKTVTASEKSLG